MTIEQTLRIGWEESQRALMQCRLRLSVSLFVNAVQMVGLLILFLGLHK